MNSVSSEKQKICYLTSGKMEFSSYRKHFEFERSGISQCGFLDSFFAHKTNEKIEYFRTQPKERNSISNFYILLQSRKLFSVFVEFIFEVNLRSGIFLLPLCCALFKIHKNQKRTKPISTTACKYVGVERRQSFSRK